MDLNISLTLFTLLLVGVGVFRLAELRISKRRQRALVAQGAALLPEPRFAIMVALHTGVLVCAGLEAWVTQRPPVPALSALALAAMIGATLLRWWVIATLGPHWNVRVVDSGALGVVSDGPFRYVRHPNYVAVFVELLALPLVHAAWVTALVGSAAHIWVLYHRIRAEEAVLLAHPAYQSQMAHKPRFVPWRR